MKKNYLNPTDFDALQSYVTGIFESKPNFLSVKPEEQKLELESLEKTIGSQRFFFVVDMTRFEITHISGVNRWLGYSENDFSLKQYWRLVHPGTQKMAHAVFVQMADILCRGKFKLEFMVQRYSSLTAVKHYNGEYLLLKRVASVFQYDNENRLTEYLNEFTIIGKYNDEPLSPEFFNDNGEIEKERGAILMQQVIDRFIGMKVFSVNELRVARILAYDSSATKKTIGAQLEKSPNTIDTYCKRFLKKARDYFKTEFATVNEAAMYLKKNGIL